MKRFTLLVMMPALLAMTGCQARKKSTGTPLSATNMVSSETGVSHVHEYYRFSIKGLGPQWRLLEDKQRESMLPDAAAMVSKVGGSHGAVIVETYEGSDLKAYTEMICANMEAMSVGYHAGEIREVDFNGGKAMRRSIEASFNEVLFNYEVMTFLHQGMGYQVLAWRPKEAAAAQDLEEFIASVGIEEGAVKVPPPAPAPDSIGIGSRIRGGSFESAVSGLVAKPAEGWGLMWGLSLSTTGDDAETGIQRPDKGLFITVSHQPVDESEREKFLGSLDEGFSDNTESVGKVTWDFGGEPIEFSGVIVSGPPAIRLYMGHAVRGDRGYRVKAWHIEQEGKDLAAALSEGLGSFSFLDEKSHGELRTSLLAEEVAYGSVGEHHSVRNGVFRSFADGITWKRPAGFWQIDAGDNARLRNEASSLYAIEVESGISVQLLVEDAGGITSEEFHGAVVDLMVAGGFSVSEKRLEPLTVDGHKLLRTCLLLEGPDAHIEYHAGSVVVGDKAYQLNCFGPVSKMESKEDLVIEAVDGFSFPGKKLRPLEKRGGLHRDVRMGFEFRLPSGMTAKVSKQDVLAKLGSTVEFSGKSSMMSHIAIQAGGSGQDATIASNMVNELFKLNMDRADSAGSTEKADTIGGLPATVRSGTSDGNHMKIAVFRQGGVLHMGVFAAPTERQVDSLFSDYKSSFTLIP
ncbi:hypothetical protein OKA04_02925 [Luteolibacter flavescens]|uniref:Lipoprotein n=2 Tax=Luteolibacter flavescens TaxID=1859460 RepID=A0ABT3FJB8_9BACT|nr:hypothetical protein [Luteolibacter flavescens]